jgi:hypothetical protein
MIHDLRAKQPVTYGHEIICSGCGEEVWIAVHHGRQDWCLTCQAVGPAAAIELRVKMRDQIIAPRTGNERLSDSSDSSGV